MTTFKVIRHEPPKLQLEAEHQNNHTQVAATILTSDPVDLEAFQLELDLFPVQEGEQFKLDSGSSIRLIPIQSKGGDVCQIGGEKKSQIKVKHTHFEEV